MTEVQEDGIRHSRAPFPIVGLGASAGGLEAFEGFLRAMPADPGMAFILIQHLDPTHESVLASLLRHYTRMPVVEAGDGMPPEADHIYLIPPNRTLLIEDGVLRLHEPAEPRGHRTPIDAFFRSLARDQGDNAACVILSGAGSDGTLGLREIKEAGGLAIAQTQESARYGSMPRSASAAGLADHVLPVEQIPATLVEYFRNLGHVRDHKGTNGVRLDTADQLTRICAIIQTRTGHDFNRYKKNTLLRRIQRRMQVLQVTDVADYIEALRKNDDEVRQLFRDLLINVTQFFRDKDAFATLARSVIPRIVDNRDTDAQIRVWVPGCSTGEEAYSLAILLAERMRETGNSIRAQIFASDIDEEALDVGRIGRYPESIAEDVSPERLARFFTASEGGYTVIKELRDMCIFSVHSVIKDPPFSKLDMISCRNLLIYLGSELQAKLIPIFHYALKPDGFLFLGTSENVSQHGRLFESVDAGQRLFVRRGVPTPHDLQFPLSAPGAFQADQQRLVPRRPPESDGEIQDRLAERLILDNYAPAFALVTETGDIVHVSSRTGKYLELPAGTPVLNVVDMARPEIRNDIRAALRRAVRDRRRVAVPNIDFDMDGSRQTMDLVVHPVANANQYMVVFQDIGTLRAETVRDAELNPNHGEGDDGHIQELESELQVTRERLRATIEELETSNEELKSSNEEMMSMNEELQSTNEELESSKEELQSINEELETVNVELRHKLQELSHANSDLQNLFDSTDIATIFLSNELRIKNFTPATKKIFNLIESDRGRPLVDLAAKFPLGGLEDEAAAVIRTLAPVEREIGKGGAGPDLLMRVVPYRTVENVIEGVVLTFVDVSRLKQAERRVMESEARYRAVLQGGHDAALVFPLEGRRLGLIQEANAAARRLLGYSDAEMRVMRLADVVGTPPADLAAWADALRQQGTVVSERDYRTHDGSVIPMEESAALVEFGDQSLVVVLARDIRDRRESERHQALLMRELQHRIKNTLATVGAIVTYTGQGVEDFQSFRTVLDGRLKALAEAHNHLTDNNWQSVPLRALAEDATRAYGNGARVAITGDLLMVTPKAALTLAMSLHELVTNAAKHGALSAPGGRVGLAWRRLDDPDPVLEIDWQESGGPKIEQAPGRGFGRFLLERGIAHELDGKVDLRFEPDGVHCVVRLPWHQAIGGESEKD
jgi:two-component system CheB/CheR fusion protein